MSDAPRPMIGLFAQLTPEQQAAALAYDGQENHGDPAFLKINSAETKIRCLRDWVSAKHDAAVSLGYDKAASRYWQRLVALEDVIRIFEEQSE